MQLSNRARDKLELFSMPALFSFELSGDIITDINETESLSGNVLFFSDSLDEAIELLARNLDSIDRFVVVDGDLNVKVLGEPEKEANIEGIFEKLYKSQEGLEYRDEQIKMANVIYQAMESSKDAIIEAPTGTGKSLAYLVPALIYSKKHNKRVVISTNTKNLQQQLVNKDLPILESVFDFKVALAFGRNNYICRRKAENLLTKGNTLLFETDAYSFLKEFLSSTETGLRSELYSKEGVDETVWPLVESSSISCAHRKCPYYRSGCFFYRARKKLDHANLIVANHHIVLSHSIMEGAEILPDFDVLIVDEAHNIERNATNYYTQTAKTREILSLLDMLFSLKKGKEIGLLSGFDCDSLKESIKKTKGNLNTLFDKLMATMEKDEVIIANNNKNKFSVIFGDVAEELNGVSLKLKQFISSLDEVEVVDFQSVHIAINQFKNMVLEFLEPSSDGSVYWIKRFKNSLHFNITPLNIRDALKNYLLEKLKSSIFISATLSVGGDFDFFKKMVGIDDAVEFIAKGDFDYERNSRLFIVDDMPKPDEDSFGDAVSQSLLSIAKALKGSSRGVLTLFTSYKLLNKVYDRVEHKIKKLGFSLFRQGELDNFELLRKFKEGNGFLLATSSFWEGIDVKGEELSVVVIVKLPFEVPTTPVEVARYDSMREEGLSPFFEYALPKAVIRLKQGLGRLLRQKQDRGVMLVLDSRIVNKSYGKVFLKSLDYMKQERISRNEIEKRIVDFFSSFSG